MFKNMQFSLRKNQNKQILRLPAMKPSHRDNTSKNSERIFRKFIMGTTLKFFSTKSKSEACLSKENNSK